MRRREFLSAMGASLAASREHVGTALAAVGPNLKWAVSIGLAGYALGAAATGAYATVVLVALIAFVVVVVVRNRRHRVRPRQQPDLPTTPPGQVGRVAREPTTNGPRDPTIP